MLAGPVFIEESLSLAVGYTDWWLAGHYFPGAATFAAMSLMAYLLWLLPSMFASLAIGVTAVVARRFGEGRPEDANRAVHQAMFERGGSRWLAWSWPRDRQ
ncbi:MAG: MATE family efflux transporter [Pirellulaceae bacterium]